MSKYGGCVHVYVDKHSKEGVVYVKGFTREAAITATKAIHGRYFDGKMIQAAYIPEANYVELFPDAATVTGFYIWDFHFQMSSGKIHPKVIFLILVPLPPCFNFWV